MIEVKCINNYYHYFITGQQYLLTEINGDVVLIQRDPNNTWTFAFNHANTVFDLSRINKLKAFL